MDGMATLYIVVRAGIDGYVVIARVPSLLHLPLLSGANFVHGVILCGAMIALAGADDNVERAVGFVAVVFAAGNVVGGYLVTDRLLILFERRMARRTRRARGAEGARATDDAGEAETRAGERAREAAERKP